MLICQKKPQLLVAFDSGFTFKQCVTILEAHLTCSYCRNGHFHCCCSCSVKTGLLITFLITTLLILSKDYNGSRNWQHMWFALVANSHLLVFCDNFTGSLSQNVLILKWLLSPINSFALSNLLTLINNWLSRPCPFHMIQWSSEASSTFCWYGFQCMRFSSASPTVCNKNTLLIRSAPATSSLEQQLKTYYFVNPSLT